MVLLSFIFISLSLQKLFSTCTRVPEIEGTLHCKDFGKKSWSKKFIFLRGSGLYSSSKGKSKVERCHSVDLASN